VVDHIKDVDVVQVYAIKWIAERDSVVYLLSRATDLDNLIIIFVI